MIRFDSVSKQYRGGQRPALNSIDLEILRGEFVFLVGASGSGKSSCLRLILKEEKPSSGKIHVLGQDLGRISSRKVPYFRRNIGVVFQDFRLLPNKSVFDNVAFSLQVIGKSKGFIQEAVPDTLKMVGLSGKAQRLPHELSGGEQQRVAIARAVVNKPAVLLADEPTGNLDPTTSAGIMALLERINAAGTTVVMATHEAGIVDEMQRRVIELSGGAIIRDEKAGGYGQTQAVPVIVDGMQIVASDDTPVATPPHIVETISAAEVPDPDLRAGARPGGRAAEAAPVAHAAPAPAPAAASAPAQASDAGDLRPRTSAIPVQAPAAEQVPAAQPVAAPVAAAAHPTPTEAAAAPAVAADSADESTDTGSQSVQTGDNVPVETASHVQIQSQTGPIYLPAADDHVPEQLSLAERLGLRSADDDIEPGEQNVGPTK